MAGLKKLVNFSMLKRTGHLVTFGVGAVVGGLAVAFLPEKTAGLVGQVRAKLMGETPKVALSIIADAFQVEANKAPNE